MDEDRLTLKQAAERAGVSPVTLWRWARSGVIREVDGSGDWTAAAAAHARIVARLRERGHSLEHIREAGRQGRLAYGFIEEPFPHDREPVSIEEASDATGLEPALIERFWAGIGLPPQALENATDEDVQALQYVAAVLAGFPLVAFLQLVRVYGQALAQIADAEVRPFHSQALAQIADAEVRPFHIYVHESLIHEGVPGLEMAEEMSTLARDLLPLASPLMDYVHQRYLQRFIAQDVVGHMELELEGDLDLGRVRVAIAFADLAGDTGFTEEEGDEEALSFVERFVERVMTTLPEDARVVKTIGDEVMVVGQDMAVLTDWAVGFQRLYDERPEPRIGMHYGATLYRDGDYFGREVNLASRVVARARGGEVLVTDAGVDAVDGLDHLDFDEIGQVKLKGFQEPRRLCRASPKE